MGRPITQYPKDIVAFQEVVFSVKPDLDLETGIALGGSLVLSASLFSLLDVMEGADPRQSKREVLNLTTGTERVLESLDSNHTHEHVLDYYHRNKRYY
jgi:cephalosporin hydroxylase